jgi:hypothetical protein
MAQAAGLWAELGLSHRADEQKIGLALSLNWIWLKAI